MRQQPPKQQAKVFNLDHYKLYKKLLSLSPEQGKKLLKAILAYEAGDTVETMQQRLGANQ